METDKANWLASKPVKCPKCGAIHTKLVLSFDWTKGTVCMKCQECNTVWEEVSFTEYADKK
jgi:phage FluMu protein Com